MHCLSQISIYPVKSTRGLSLSHSWVESIGLSFDRRFMLADEKGRMLTGRACAELLLVSSALTRDGLVLSHPQQPSLSLRYSDFGKARTDTHVWKDEFQGHATTEAANLWFSEVLGRPCQLLYCGEHTPRFSQSAGVEVSFADGFPLLLISEGSLAELNRRSPVTHQMAQFRPNLVVTGSQAFAEDEWDRVRIGEVEFRLASPCSRCVFTTRDPQSGAFLPGKEPLTTLSRFRKAGDGKINFGMNLIPLNEGMIELGNPVEVLATRMPEHYQDN